jgi:hypothetical protein
MTVIYGQGNPDATRVELLKRVEKIKDPSARLAVVEAIDELAPKGDIRAANALDTMVAADKRSGEQGVLMADDSVVKIALRLRARAP